ncbi:MAG: class I SAM-dependent methyltransferase [Candidatus Brocadiales bacterium]|nr:class I SAM-dependent methyltransferase [Candidatus Brocadiales bacterium]
MTNQIPSVENKLINRYLEVLKKSLLNELYIENEARIIQIISSVVNNEALDLKCLFDTNLNNELIEVLIRIKQDGDFLTINKTNPDKSLTPAPELRNLTELSHTMIGRKRLDNLQWCMEEILRNNIPGDFIETGVWRGGTTIFMRGFLASYDVNDRFVWVADSFKGVPPSSHKEDEEIDLSASVLPVLAVSLEKVKELFSRYDLLDSQVKFLKGWFKDTLHTAPISKLSLLRLDGDLYESTMDALGALYDKVTPGGFIIIDDYGSVPSCKVAVNTFRKEREIEDELIPVDKHCVFWVKT